MAARRRSGPVPPPRRRRPFLSEGGSTFSLSRSILGTLVLSGSLGAVSHDRSEATTLPICYDSSSPSAPVDRRVARAVERAMHVESALVPFDGSSGVSERYFRILAKVRCSVIMGYPVDSIDPDPPPGLVLTDTYLRTSYVIASIGNPRTLASIPAGSVVSVGSSTVPNFYLVGALGPTPAFVSDVHLTQDEALDALVQHHAAVAMVWLPSVSHYRALHPSSHIVTNALPIPHARWGVAALFDPSHAAFAARFDTAVATLLADGTLHRYYADAGLEKK